MNRPLLSLAALALLRACQDSTGPLPIPRPPAISPWRPRRSSRRRPPCRAPPVGGREPERHPGPRQPGHRRDLPGCRPVRDHLQPQRDRLRLHRHYQQRLQPGPRRLHRRGHLSANGVYVETKNQGGGLTDGPFNLLVACGPLNTRFAVVGYSANLVRSTAGTTLTALGAGRYQVRFTVGVGGCAFLATVADPANRWSSTRPACTPARAPMRRPSISRPRTRAAGCRTACRSTWRHLPGHGHSRFAVVKASGISSARPPARRRADRPPGTTDREQPEHQRLRGRGHAGRSTPRAVLAGDGRDHPRGDYEHRSAGAAAAVLRRGDGGSGVPCGGDLLS